MKKTIDIYNAKHLGDSVFITHYLRKVCEKNSDIVFNLYVRASHLGEINAQIGDYNAQIKAMRLNKLPKSKLPQSINGWAGAIAYNNVGRRKGIFLLNERYDVLFQNISDRIGVENPIPGKQCTVIDNPAILEDTGLKYDILLINSKPLSAQYYYSKRHFLEFIDKWKDKYSIITTHPTDVNDIPCTRDYNLNLLQIGNISLNCKYIVGIATAPIINCFNIWNIDKVKKWYVLSNRSTYTYNDRIAHRGTVLKAMNDIGEN